METYVQKAPDSSFINLVEDDNFKRDLVSFLVVVGISIPKMK